MRRLRVLIVLGVLALASASGAGILRHALAPDAFGEESLTGSGRTIVLGFDGMDPVLAERWMADGTLPNFARRAQDGHFQPLATTNPAQSPVAWSTFATGLDPGEHGIFDFLRLNRQSYQPEYSVSYVEPPQTVLRGFGYQLPLEEGRVRSRRVGTPFWTAAEREGRQASVLRVPVTYPADPIQRSLAGIDVPDLLGSQGGGVPEALVEDNNKKWSGDHLIEPTLVAGVPFTSFRPEVEIASIREVPDLVRISDGLSGTIDPALVKPSMGVFDVASPLFSWVDSLMSGWLSDLIRLMFWGVVAGVVSMGLYKLTSNQTRLAAIKAESAALRKKMAGFDGPFAEFWSMTGRNLGLAMRQLWVTLTPAILASVPVVFLLVWVSNSFDARLPMAGDRVEVEAYPSAGHELPPLYWRGDGGVVADGVGTWSVVWPQQGGTTELVDSDGTVLLSLPIAEPVGVVHQRRWWNTLLGNPAGYLPSPGDIDTVGIDLPRREYLPFGPDWLRGWIPFFFGVVIIVSLLLKFLWRLH